MGETGGLGGGDRRGEKQKLMSRGWGVHGCKL